MPPESLFYDLHGEDTLFSPKFLLGQPKDARLYSPILPPYGEFLNAAFSPDSTKIAILSATNEVVLEILDAGTFTRNYPPIKLKMKINGKPSSSTSIVISPDGNKIVVVSNTSMEMWSSKRNQTIIQFFSDRDIIDFKNTMTVFLGNDCLVHCCLKENSIQVWSRNMSNFKDNKNLYTLQMDKIVSCMAVSPNGTYLCCVLTSNELSIWDLNTREAIAKDARVGDSGDSEDVFNTLSISCDRTYVACGSKRRILKLWNSRTASLIWSQPVQQVLYRILMPNSSDVKQLLTMSSHGSEIRIWDIASGSGYMHDASYGSINKIAAVSTEEIFVTSWSGHPTVWGIQNIEKDTWSNGVAVLPGETLQEIIFLPDGGLIASGSGVKRSNIVVWDGFGTENALKQTLRGDTSQILEQKFSLNGRMVFSRDCDANVFLWHRNSDRETFKLLRKHECSDADTAQRLFDSLVQGNSHEDAQTTQFRNRAKEYFSYDYRDKWICLANGTRLWYVPSELPGQRWNKVVQKGWKIVVYGRHFAVLFEYIDKQGL